MLGPILSTVPCPTARSLSLDTTDTWKEGREQGGFTELHMFLEEGQGGISLCAGNYNLSSVLPTAPDMAQFKQGVRSVAGKLSVFANGVMTSIQVSEAMLGLLGAWSCHCELGPVLQDGPGIIKA